MDDGDKTSEQEDVLAEHERVCEADPTDTDENLVVAQNLRKVHHSKDRGGKCCSRDAQSKSKVAVQNMSVGIARGETLGLLGVNGAGKTTNFEMLTGEVHPSEGDAMTDNQSIRKSMREAQKRVGCCPQLDALLSRLTALQLCAQCELVPVSSSPTSRILPIMRAHDHA